MNIVMLGHSNAGKTTYMSSMYRELATRGVNGFWLRAQEDADHRRLLTAANGVAVGRYPPASDRRGEYPLTLRYGSNQVIDFNWKDHRGGALREKSSSSQTKALLDDVAGADAIMLFLDSADLASGAAVARARVRDLTQTVFRGLDGRQRATPIAVLLTKADLVARGSLQARVAVLQSFRTAIAAQRWVYGTILEVACGPSPMNVVVPVLFGLYFGIAKRGEELYANVQQAQAFAEYIRQQDTAWNRFKSGVTNKPSNRDLASMADAVAAQEAAALIPLIEPAQTLGAMLSSLEVF